jgi:sugar phosphate isomerase/epimerase
MGFHYLEMEGLGREHTEEVWNHRKEFRRRLDDHGVHVHNFCGVDPELVSLDDARRHAAYERFKRTAELGKFLGTETLHLASYAPPVRYIGPAPYELNEKYAFGDQFRLILPEGFRWQRVWDVLVESCRFAADVAKAWDCTVLMEPRVGEVVCSPDSMIQLIHDVACDNFRANFDTAHFSAQRENVVLALAKLEGLYANVHVSDNDPVNALHTAVGDGRIDWKEFLRVLSSQGYQGYLGLDLGPTAKIEEDLLRSAHYLENLATELGIPIQR